jgi:hypothetical protein
MVVFRRHSACDWKVDHLYNVFTADRYDVQLYHDIIKIRGMVIELLMGTMAISITLLKVALWLLKRIM